MYGWVAVVHVWMAPGTHLGEGADLSRVARADRLRYGAYVRLAEHRVMAGAPEPRIARFRCTLVLAWPDGHDEVSRDDLANWFSRIGGPGAG